MQQDGGIKINSGSSGHQRQLALLFGRGAPCCWESSLCCQRGRVFWSAVHSKHAALLPALQVAGCALDLGTFVCGIILAVTPVTSYQTM